MSKIKLIATDLDGTFLKNDKSISKQNLDALNVLGNSGIIKIAATGRNLRKVMDVIPQKIPFDYVIFSSGAGVVNWKSQKLLLKENLKPQMSGEIARFLVKKKLNFNAFLAVPNNHHLWYHRGGEPCEEFERYFNFNKKFACPFSEKGILEKSLSQFIVILPNNPEKFYLLKKEIESMFPEAGVIRSTSPLGTGFIWLEIFNRNVSKGNALSFICNKLSILQDETASIGNDYNDIGLLEYSNLSYIVKNAPNDLREKYSAAPSNEENGFSVVVNQLLKY
ncbi:MAG: HAD family phosphatase [Mariniphaga sp.]|nr:HAD family phosphatase [Mariniphaga sp.]